MEGGVKDGDLRRVRQNLFNGIEDSKSRCIVLWSQLSHRGDVTADSVVDEDGPGQTRSTMNDAMTNAYHHVRVDRVQYLARGYGEIEVFTCYSDSDLARYGLLERVCGE